MATALICTLGALNVWTEPPLARVFPDTAPTVESRSVEARMYAARGERESFQLCVRAGNEAIERVVVKAEPLDKQIGAPDIRRVGYLRVPDSSTGRDLWPDPLLEFQPFGLEADETGVMWVTYNIPKVAKPGTHKGMLSVSIGNSPGGSM